MKLGANNRSRPFRFEFGEELAGGGEGACRKLRIQNGCPSMGLALDRAGVLALEFDELDDMRSTTSTAQEMERKYAHIHG